jgi:hypothetical protein
VPGARGGSFGEDEPTMKRADIERARRAIQNERLAAEQQPRQIRMEGVA